MVTARLPQAEIDLAGMALRDGEVIAFPTETVYGLGADAQNSEAIAKVFALKGRPTGHPLIVHIDHARSLERWALAVPTHAHGPAEPLWPGPLTLVLKRAPAVDPLITGGQDTIAVRGPGHPVAQQPLRGLGRGLRAPAPPGAHPRLRASATGIAAPSANRYGHVSPTRVEHVREEFGDEVRFVL